MKTRILLGGWALALCLPFAEGGEVPVWTKLDTWRVPKVEMENLSLGEAVAWVRAKSREIDPNREAGENAGLRIGFERKGAEEPERLVTLKAENILLGELLDAMGKITKRNLEIFDDGVVLRKADSIEARSTEVDGMVTRTFWAGSSFAEPETPGQEQADDPFDPDRTEAPKRDVNGSVEARAYLEKMGISFPDGAAVIYPGPGGTITVRTTPAQMELVEAYFSVLDGPGSKPKQCTIRAEIYAIEHGLALALLRENEGSPGAEALLRRIAKMRESGDTELVAMPMIVTSSGRRAKIENGWSRDLVTGYTVEDGRDRATTEQVTSGVTLEVDPVIGPDNRTIELNIALDIATGEPTVTRIEILAPASGKTVLVEVAETREATVQTAITTLSGQPQLLGVIPPRVPTDKSLLVIVTATIRPERESFPEPE